MQTILYMRIVLYGHLDAGDKTIFDEYKQMTLCIRIIHEEEKT